MTKDWTSHSLSPRLDALRELPGPLAEYRLCASHMALAALHRAQEPGLSSRLRMDYSRLGSALAVLSERLHLLALTCIETSTVQEAMDTLRRQGEDIDIEAYQHVAWNAYHYATLLPGATRKPGPPPPPPTIYAPCPDDVGLVDVAWGLPTPAEAAALIAAWEARHA